MLYAALTAVTTACFVLLNHTGNQTPVAVVAPKIAAEFKAMPKAWDTRWEHAYQPWEYCYISGAVLAGSMPSPTPLYDALFPRIVGTDGNDHLPGGGHCGELQRLVSGSEQAMLGQLAELLELDDPLVWRERRRMRPHQWFGSKALYAIGLRFLTIRQYHEFIRKATYAGYVVLAAAFLLLGWRALLVASPLLLFGAAFSGIEHMSNVAKGTPYIWALITPALVAMLLRCSSVPAFATRLFCFFAGMVASYLWLFGGANFIAAVLVGLVAWLHGEPSAVKARAARSATCMLAHAAGFVVGMGIKIAIPFHGPETSNAIWASLSRIFNPLPHDLLGKEIGMWMEWLPIGVAQADLVIASALIALGAALAVAGYRAWRQDWLPLQEVLGMGVLGIAPLIHFLLPNDTAYAAARLMYLPLALCWTAFVVVLLRTPRPVVHALVGLALGSALIALRLGWQHTAATALLKMEDATTAQAPRPLIEGYFDVHLKGGRLIYHRARCENMDMKRRFVLDVFPQNLADLPDEHKAAGRVRTVFYFADHRLFTFGEGCVAVVDADLPGFPIAKITTHRYCCYEDEPSWRASVILDVEPLQHAARRASAVPPVARDVFDIHHVGNELIYLREPCAKEDARALFFLHTFPNTEAGSSDFRSLDFDFFAQGVLHDGQCVAVMALPAEDIAHVRTGQYVEGEGQVWAAEFPISQEKDTGP